MKKICVVTATRAEYGLLRPLIDRIYKSAECELQLVVTGAHLSESQGLTVSEIELDGYPICERISILSKDDGPIGITETMGRAVSEFGKCFERLKPDIVVILGDRYEMLMVASAAMICMLPIAHIHGGETTEGLIDEAIRHSITKMSALHFPSIEEYRKRIIQMGEHPNTVFTVGSLGVECALNRKLLNKEELENQLEFKIDNDTVLITMHPETLSDIPVEEQMRGLVSVLDENKNIRGIITKANTDTYGSIINDIWEDFVSRNSDRFVLFSSLGQLRYLSALKYVKAVIGNSSSGILEVPSFHIPTVNIGNRQKNRYASESVIHCDYEKDNILDAMDKALSKEFNAFIKEKNNPYEGENTSERILSNILDNLNRKINLSKSFYNLEIKS